MATHSPKRPDVIRGFCGRVRRWVRFVRSTAIFRRLWRSEPRGRGLWAGVLAVGLLAVAVGEFALQLHFNSAAPRQADWEALRPRVRQLAGGRPVVLVAPNWAEPLARLTLGEELMPLEHVARADVRRFATALEIGFFGQGHPEVAGWRELERERSGQFQLRLVENPDPQRVHFDFVSRLGPSATEVQIRRRGEEVACNFASNARPVARDLHGDPAFPRRRFACPGAVWQFVGRTVIEDERYRPRRCIWAHAPRRGGVLSIRFEGVPMGQVIRGHGGLPYFLEREKRGAAVELDVLVDGESVGVLRHADGEGWKPFEMSTRRHAGAKGTVEFLVRSRRSRQRQFCFEAVVQ